MCDPSVSATAIFVVLTVGIAYNVHARIPLPFIDEFFHLRQAQAYCAEDYFAWDPKITTPPGLYILGAAWARLLSALGVSRACGATALRSLNLFGGSVLLPGILSFVNFPSGWWTLNIVSLPLIYSYLFLFYTDVWSTVFMIGAVVAVLVQPNFKGTLWANAAGFCSLWFRQTNIVWMAFVAVVLVEQRMRKRYELIEFPAKELDPRAATSEIPRRPTYLEYLQSTCYSLSSSFISFFKACARDWYLLVPFAINFGLFGAFVVYNGGITFGDRENHQVSIHGAQLLYCATFLAFFSVPLWLLPQTVIEYLKFTMSHTITTLVSLWAINYTILHFTVIHPFLLADNRHYTFYIFRKIISRPNANYILVPAYHFCAWVVLHLLATSKYGDSGKDFTSTTPSIAIDTEKTKSGKAKILSLKPTLSLGPVGLFAWLAACILTLVPSPLFEPRYYVLPLVTFRLFTQPKHSAWEFAWNMAINTVVFFVFFSYEFSWATELAPQRIIW